MASVNNFYVEFFAICNNFVIFFHSINGVGGLEITVACRVISFPYVTHCNCFEILTNCIVNTVYPVKIKVNTLNIKPMVLFN